MKDTASQHKLTTAIGTDTGGLYSGYVMLSTPNRLGVRIYTGPEYKPPVSSATILKIKQNIFWILCCMKYIF